MPWYRRKIFWIPLVILMTFGGLGTWVWHQAPHWIARYIEEQAPWAKVGQVELGYPQVVLHDVKVNKPWVKGLLRRVVVSKDKIVTVEGGYLNIDMDKRPKKVQDEADARGVTLESLQIDEVKARKDSVSVEGWGLSFQKGEYCLKGASIRTTHKALKKWLHIPKVVVKGLCQKDNSLIQVKSALAGIHIPDGIPTLSGNHLFTFKDIEVYPIEEYVKFGSIETLEHQATAVSVAYKEGTLYVDAERFETSHRWISPTTKYFEPVKFSFKPPEGSITVGRSTLLFDLDRYMVKGDQECNEWLDILPKPVSPAIEALQDKFTGRMSFEISAEPVPHVGIKHNCKSACDIPLITDLKKPFKYQVYDKDGNLFTRMSGPGSKEWTPLNRLPVNIPSAFIKLEDPAFLNHRGILPASLKVALEQNLEKGKFYRGGSTITQQLAKNLWLRRHKTIGRKAEEAFLTMALESCLTKDQILELYFNVIEYGPDLYGIGTATWHYFNKSVEQLTLREAYFLAALLRNPKAALKPDQGGLDRAQRLMARLAKNGLLSEELVPPSDNIDTRGWETE